MRSRFAEDKIHTLISKIPITRDQFEEFLKIEHKHNPKSRWLK